jgi:VWFA-related protein
MSARATIRHTGCMLAAVFAAASLAHTQGADLQAPTFRASTDAVRVDVSVKRNGRPLSGLTADDFEIFDNGIVQRIADLSFEKGAIDVTVALDLSRSVSGDMLERLRRGVEELRRRLTSDDKLKVVTFNMRIRRILDFDEPRDRAGELVASATAGGATSLVDTVAVLLASPAQIDRRQLIIVFSDGADTSSWVEPDALGAVAARTTPTVAFVQPVEEVRVTNAQSGSSAERSGAAPTTVAGLPSFTVRQGVAAIPAFYRQLTVDTGGQVLAANGDTLTRAFATLLDDFRSSYVLHYTPSGVSGKGFHTIGVKVRKEGTFDIRARRGYAGN